MRPPAIRSPGRRARLRSDASSPTGSAPEEFVAVAPAPDAADFLFVGELRHLKGVDVLLRALAQVRRSPNGERRDRRRRTRRGASTRARRPELGLDGVVTFMGPMPAREAFRLGRTLVVPSRAESLPYIVLEAAAAGLPLLATDVGGIPEIVAGTDTDAAAAGRRAMRSPTPCWECSTTLLPRAARAVRLREAVAERFTVAAMTDAVLDLYAQVRASLAQR